MRPALALISAFLLALVAAAPVSAKPPTKEPLPPVQEFFPAGEVCDFDVLEESIDQSSKAITFDRHDGAFKQTFTGHIVERLTNLETGASVVRNSSGPAHVSVNAAGHFVIKYGGSTVLPFFDGDVTGRGLFLLKGGGAETEIGDDGFFFVRVAFPAHVEDLCATLSA